MNSGNSGELVVNFVPIGLMFRVVVVFFYTGLAHTGFVNGQCFVGQRGGVGSISKDEFFLLTSRLYLHVPIVEQGLQKSGALARYVLDADEVKLVDAAMEQGKLLDLH
jgi:hypothetical protein